MSENTFDIAVVGGGMIGSAAARHLAEGGRNIAVVAAPEPTDWSGGVGPFASHYDAGRITRVADEDPVWAELAARSIARYADIEDRSGVTFHDPRGLAWIGHRHEVEPAVANAVDRGAGARYVSRDWLYAVTGIRMPDIAGLEAMFEPGPAGVVNPRRLPHAELTLAERAGATVVREPANAVRRSQSEIVVAGSFGEVRARQVLLATGAYGARLVGVDLALVRNLRTTLRVDIGPAPELPSLIVDPVPHPDISDVYWTPPVRYPDGRTLFKIGSSLVGLEPAGADEIDPWFTTDGSEREADALLATTRDLLPGARLRSWDTVPCVTTNTAHGYPYLGFVDDDVAVAIGGNGASAKSGDEIGRLAAALFSSAGWSDDQLPANTFAPQLA